MSVEGLARAASGGRGGRTLGNVPRKAGQKPKPFSRQSLAAEAENPFSKARIVLFGAGFVSVAIGFLFILPRAIGSAFGAPNASPMLDVLRDLALNLSGAAFFGWLTFQEVEADTVRAKAREVGALIARLPVELKDDRPGAKGRQRLKLADIRAERLRRAWRPVICMGSLDFCRECVESSAEVAEAVDRSDLLVIPMLTGAGEDQSAIVEAAGQLGHVALPCVASDDWRKMCEIELEQARAQGLDESKGLVVIVKKNGRIATRFLGVPNWRVITGEVSERVEAGLDTKNI